MRAARSGDAEVPGQVLESEAREIAGARVVQLGQQVCVDDVAAGDLVAPVADRPLGDHELGRAAARDLAAAPPGEGQTVTPGARLDVLEVEAKDVVPLDHVGIALADQAGQFLQEGRVGQLTAARDRAKAGRVWQGNGDYAVALARRARELEAL